MGKVFPLKLLYILLCLVMTLTVTACPEPVNLEAFLEDENVLEMIVGRGTRFFITLRPVDDRSPQVPNIINLTKGAQATIVLENPGNLSSLFTWSMVDYPLFHFGDTLLVDTNVAPFDIYPSSSTRATYLLSVVGYTDYGEPYSAQVLVRVWL